MREVASDTAAVHNLRGQDEMQAVKELTGGANVEDGARYRIKMVDRAYPFVNTRCGPLEGSAEMYLWHRSQSGKTSI